MGFHEILATLWWRTSQKVRNSTYSKISVSKNTKLDGATHHQVWKNVKFNAVQQRTSDLMGRPNGDRVRYIKYEIPYNAVVRHEKLNTLWRCSCTAMAVFYQRTIARNLKGCGIESSARLYANVRSYMSHWYNLQCYIHTGGRTDEWIDGWMAEQRTH